MDTLTRLTETAKQAATAYEMLERQTVEARREQVLIYGRALQAIRKEMSNDRAFGHHLMAHQLDIRNNRWRSDAMWLAKQVDGLLISVTHCPHSNPTDIRHWARKQDPNYNPKNKNTKAGVSKPTLDVREYVRPMVERGESINVQQVVQETGYSRITVEAAIAAERGRKEGLEEAPVDVFKLADAWGLSATAKKKLHALDARLRREYETSYGDRLTAGIRKHMQEYVLPEYNRLLTEADERLARYRPPLSHEEYNILIWALHEDQTTRERRADAFALVHRLKVVLRGADKETLKPRTLPSSLAEMMARRKRPIS